MKKIITLMAIMAILPLQAHALFPYQQRAIADSLQTSSINISIDKQKQIDALLAKRARIANDGQMPDKGELHTPPVVEEVIVVEVVEEVVPVEIVTCTPADYSVMSVDELVLFIKQLMDLIIKD